MNLMALAFPFSNPDSQIAIKIQLPFHWGFIPIKWYGLAYMAGLILGWLYMRYLCRKEALWKGPSPMRPELADDFLFWAALGTIVGGRVGLYVFYEPSLLLKDPLGFFRTWEGGMRFHGGLIGVGLAAYIFARSHKIAVLSLTDLCAAVVPFGLFFGRLANFVNGEIYGRITTMPWGVVFPEMFLDPEDKANVGPRHPTQIYEAFLEGVVLFAILRFVTHRFKSLASPGMTTGVFLIAYAAFRSFVEYFKEPDNSQFFNTPYFTEGVVYSVPMIALGIYLIWRAKHRAGLIEGQKATI